MLTDNSQVMSKTKELCVAIAEDPEYKSLLEKVERFLEDDASKLQFQSIQERSHELGQKQQSGLELSAGEVEDLGARRSWQWARLGLPAESGCASCATRSSSRRSPSRFLLPW